MHYIVLISTIQQSKSTVAYVHSHVEITCLVSLALEGRFFTTRATREEGISCLFTDIPTIWGMSFISQCHTFLPSHTVHGVLEGRMLKWFAILFSSGLYFVRALNHDPSILGGPTWHG